jgi:hypothetical protein
VASTISAKAFDAAATRDAPSRSAGRAGERQQHLAGKAARSEACLDDADVAQEEFIPFPVTALFAIGHAGCRSRLSTAVQNGVPLQR